MEIVESSEHSEQGKGEGMREVVLLIVEICRGTKCHSEDGLCSSLMKERETVEP